MKKKKNKIVKLTEIDYANYIMALKEEKPVRVIIPDEEKDKK